MPENLSPLDNPKQDGICPFLARECIGSRCALFNDGCAFESRRPIEKELAEIKSVLKDIKRDLR